MKSTITILVSIKHKLASKRLNNTRNTVCLVSSRLLVEPRLYEAATQN